MNEKYFLKFDGKAVVRALGRILKSGDKFEVTPEQARQFNNPRAKELGIKIVKEVKKVKKKKEVKKQWSKK